MDLLLEFDLLVPLLFDLGVEFLDCISASHEKDVTVLGITLRLQGVLRHFIWIRAG